METPVLGVQLGDDPFPPQPKHIVLNTAKAERRFGSAMRFNVNLTEQDSESVINLDCILNQRQCCTNLSIPFSLTEQEGGI